MKFCGGFLTCSTVSQRQKILEQDTSIAVNIYKGQITSYSFVPVCIFYAQIIFLVLSGKMLMQYKVQSHTMELDQKACGTSMPNGIL